VSGKQSRFRVPVTAAAVLLLLGGCSTVQRELAPNSLQPHGTAAEEWGAHRGVVEWWYLTGVLELPIKGGSQRAEPLNLQDFNHNPANETIGKDYAGCSTRMGNRWAIALPRPPDRRMAARLDFPERDPDLSWNDAAQSIATTGKGTGCPRTW